MQILRAGTWRAEPGLFPRGFTLVELSVVMMIVAVVLLITFPRFENSLFASNIKQASRRLSAAVRYAQSQAAQKRKIYRVVYNLDRHTYWIAIHGSDDTFLADASYIGQERKLPEGVSFEDVISPRDGKVREGQTYTQFLPKGMADRSQIHLKDDSGRKFTLIVQPLTGEIQFFDTYVEEEWKVR